MATVLSGSVFPEDYDYKTPKHLIMWLDDHIGDPERYLHLKKAFTSNVDPRNQAPTMLTDRDYNNLLRGGEAMEVSFGGVLFLLLAFTNPQECHRAFEQYKDRYVLLITSGTLGRIIVHRIIQDYQQVFTDPVTNDPYKSIYVFCKDIAMNYDWAIQDKDYIQIFTHEADLLARMTRDMADYYFTQGERLRATEHLEDAFRFYHWSKKLFLQYEKMGQPCRKYLENIDRITKEIENTLRPPVDYHNYDMRDNDSDDEEGKGCEPCS